MSAGTLHFSFLPYLNNRHEGRNFTLVTGDDEEAMR